jgi:hypothetical protein
MAAITKVLGDAGIGLASVLQHEEHTGPGVPIVIVTYEAQEGALQAAVERIDDLPVTLAPTVRIRIEE